MTCPAAPGAQRSVAKNLLLVAASGGTVNYGETNEKVFLCQVGKTGVDKTGVRIQEPASVAQVPPFGPAARNDQKAVGGRDSNSMKAGS